MKNNREQIKQWVENWAVAGELLEKLRIEEIRKTDTIQAMHNLKSASRSALKISVPQQTSGLIQFRQLLARIYADD